MEMQLANEVLSWQHYEQEWLLKIQSEERLCLIEKLIVFLPYVRRQVLTLHYFKGNTTGRIASLLSMAEERVALELAQGIDFVKKVIKALEKAKGGQIMEKDIPLPVGFLRNTYAEDVLFLRHNRKMPFVAIAAQLKLSVIVVNEIYAAGHAQLHQHRQ